MTRVQADLALVFAGLIWGFGFVAQKNALGFMGPATFVAARFFISSLFILPFVLRENGLPQLYRSMTRRDRLKIGILSVAFPIGVLFQQYGIVDTSATHAAFLTSLYIVMVALAGIFIYHQKISTALTLACLLSVIGVWLLSGSNGDLLSFHLSRGDILILLCAFGFAVQVVMLGNLSKKLQLPFALSFIQYMSVALVAFFLALVFEPVDWQALLSAWRAILYAGIASGGIAYTLQAVAQQHTPPADAAIIMSSEAFFGGVGGIWLLHEPLTTQIVLGCLSIMVAIMLVELGPLTAWHKAARAKRSGR